MIMESPEPSKSSAISSSASSATNSAVANIESPQVQESPFLRFVNNLSPIKQPVKASHVAQGFVVLNSPPLVFASPRISCHRETQLLERPPCTHSPSGVISHSDNRCKILIEAPDESRKSTAELPLTGNDTQKHLGINDALNTQNCSPPPSVDKYLADPGDIDQLYSDNPDVEQSNDAEKKIISKIDSKDDPGDKTDKPLLSLEESNKVNKRSACVEEPAQIEGKKKDVERASGEHSFSANVFKNQGSHDSLAQTLHDVKLHEDCAEMVSTSHEGADNISQDGSEASLKHQGLRRRCLQFGEAESNKSHMKSNAKIKMVKLSEGVTIFPQSCSGNLPAGCPKPSGIGLHLNSIVNAMPTGDAATTAMRSSDSLEGMKSSSINSNKVDNMKRCSISSNMDHQSLIDIGNDNHPNEASIAADVSLSESPVFVQPIAQPPESHHDKRKLSPMNVGNHEEPKLPSPTKKKKKISNSTDDNGCKRCNCKKSKCLKLYCDCFAAGIYCADPCSCQSCLNRPEYEDRVLETRKQIESRNPLAFLPKIVPQSTDLPTNNMEDANLMTPSSARHKRGCNCKRSMCLKKYCECYQANVGCSNGCRCDGCKNVYGTKEDYVSKEHAFSKERVSSRVENGSDSAFLNRLDKVASKADLYDLHRLSPITPSLQCSDPGKEAAKSRLHSEKPFAETEVNMLPSPGSMHNSLANLETNEMLETTPFDWQVDCGNLDIMEQSSPFNTIANILQAPLSNPESMSNSLFTSNTKECANIPQSRQSNGSIRQISGSSLRWRSSPNTPRARLGDKQYMQSADSDSRLSDILEDETPDILKESSTPPKSVKANSPNQKRVSPPHGHLRGLGSSSSGGFRSGRKFILKSVPSFPPLTPCIDSKGNSNDGSGNNTSK